MQDDLYPSKPCGIGRLMPGLCGAFWYDLRRGPRSCNDGIRPMLMWMTLVLGVGGRSIYILLGAPFQDIFSGINKSSKSLAIHTLK
jgi:hypothetical protein